jgi:hypothetical protein
MEQVNLERAYELLIKVMSFYLGYGFNGIKPAFDGLQQAVPDEQLMDEWNLSIKEARKVGLQVTRLRLRLSRGLWIKNKNYIGSDRRKIDWYIELTLEGKQYWVMARDYVIRNCGINDVPKPYTQKSADEGPYASPSGPGLLTLEEVYAAIYLFFDKQYTKKEDGDLAVVLGCMSTLVDNSTADHATWYDWLDVAGVEYD